MDEVNTTAEDTTVTPLPEKATLEQVATPPPSADPALPILQTADPDPVQRHPLDIPPEPTIQGVPLDNSLPIIQVSAEPQIVERIVEKVVEKEVIKEVIKEIPVEKIVEKEVIKEVIKEVPVEKIVYRDAPPALCPPPTDEEREAIKRDFLIELSHEGTATRHQLMQEKLDTVMALFNTKEHIMREDVIDVLDCSGTTATRLLTELRHEGKIVLHGTGGNGASYTKNL